MFDNLSEKLDKALHVLKGHGQITEINVAETLKEVRRALLDADVNFKIAKEFTNTVKEKALGQNVLTSLQPGQLMVKLVAVAPNSIPDAPIKRVSVPFIVTFPVGPSFIKPSTVKLPPISTVFADVTVLSHRRIFEEIGVTPLDQLLPKLRSFALSNLVIVCACIEVMHEANTKK